MAGVDEPGSQSSDDGSEKQRRRVILLGARPPRAAPRQFEEFRRLPGKIIRARARVAAMRRAADKRHATGANG